MNKCNIIFSAYIDETSYLITFYNKFYIKYISEMIFHTPSIKIIEVKDINRK